MLLVNVLPMSWVAQGEGENTPPAHCHPIGKFYRSEALPRPPQSVFLSEAKNLNTPILRRRPIFDTTHFLGDN